MAIINYTDQLKYAGSGYLDAKMNPVATVADLKTISRNQRFVGLTVTVLNDGNPQDYWLVNGTGNDNWVLKNDFSALKLALEDGWLKLSANGKEISSVDFNDFIPSNGSGDGSDKFLSNVEYAEANEEGVKGLYMRFTYNDQTVLYLDMAPYIQTYEEGEGIVIDGKVISINEALLGRITTLEAGLENVEKTLASKVDNETLDNAKEELRNEFKAADNVVRDEFKVADNVVREEFKIADNQVRQEFKIADNAVREEFKIADNQVREEFKAADAAILAEIEELKNQGGTSDPALETRVGVLETQVATNTQDITTAKVDINQLKADIEGLIAAGEGLLPDGKSIGLTEGEERRLTVKISATTDGNIMGVADDNSGLYAVIPCFFEDSEIE